MKIVRHFVFLLVSIVLFPVTFIGVWLHVLVALVTRYSRGISLTAYQPLFVRSTLNQFAIRKDPLATQVLHALPGGHPLIMALFFGPFNLAVKLSGHVPNALVYPPPSPSPWLSQVQGRTHFLDEAALKCIESGVSQLVFLGAGFDTRSFIFAREGLTIFEVDVKGTQGAKKNALTKAKAKGDDIVFVEANFNKESWLDRLVGSGFDKNKPAFFHWEGVTYYLDEDAVKGTLQTVADECAKGSVIAFDYFANAMVQKRSPFFWRGVLFQFIMAIAGEPWTFGIDSAERAEEKAALFVEACGLSLDGFSCVGDTKHPVSGLVAASLGPGRAKSVDSVDV